MVTLMMTVIMGAAGMSVDLGNWYLTISKQQKAADAAALAAAPYLPGNWNGARDAAIASLKSNEIDVSYVKDNDAVKPRLIDDARFTDHVSLSRSSKDNRIMQVEIGKTVNNFFIGMLGHPEQVISRTGSALYQAEIPMGSPSPVLGNEPAGDKQGTLTRAVDAGMNGKYWLNLSGPNTVKTSGDRYAAGRCGLADTGCAASGLNTEFAYGADNDAERSHRYTVRIPKSTTGPVTVQVFDGAYVEVSDRCDTSNGTIDAARNATGDAVRFANGTTAYCTGDFKQGAGGPAAQMTASTYKAGSSGDLGEKIGQSVTFPVATSAAAVTSQMNAGSSNNPLTPSLSDSFRAWSTIATLNGAGEYIIEVKTPPNAGGTNRFALRAGVLVGDKFNETATEGVTVAAKGHLAVYTNATAADTSFYFAKLTSSSAGRTVKIDLFDIGDASGGDSVDLQLVAPKGATGLPGGFSSKCTQEGPEVGYTLDTGGECGIKNASPTRYNGKKVTLAVDVPASYVCDDDTGSDCWMALRFVVKGSGGTITSSNPSVDTTTWSIQACGRPLAIVPNNGLGDECDK